MNNVSSLQVRVSSLSCWFTVMRRIKPCFSFFNGCHAGLIELMCSLAYLCSVDSAASLPCRRNTDIFAIVLSSMLLPYKDSNCMHNILYAFSWQSHYKVHFSASVYYSSSYVVAIAIHAGRKSLAGLSSECINVSKQTSTTK